ncbi:MAG: PLP-dependent transferase, partial [Proteobacteria bacterium]|nr:PLP-dependent transferase [Pseudomonadota bacterium]
EPSAGYHGVKFFETFGNFGFTMKARMETLRTFGPALSPFNAWQLLQGVETLPLRMQRHCTNALAVAIHLEQHPAVAWVNYPGLASSAYHGLAQRYLPSGASAILCFGIKEGKGGNGQGAGEKFIDAVQFLSHLANIGDARSLVIHPASTTHRQLSPQEQLAAGVTPDLIRISVGIETLADILWDIDQALARSTA